MRPRFLVDDRGTKLRFAIGVPWVHVLIRRGAVAWKRLNSTALDSTTETLTELTSALSHKMGLVINKKKSDSKSIIVFYKNQSQVK